MSTTTALAPLPAALLLAWGGDALFGEPPNAWHPVAWLGRVMQPLGTRLPALPPSLAFAGGTIVWLVLAAMLGIAATAWQSMLLRWPLALSVPLLALALKPCFAWRMLRDEVAAVEGALAQGLDAGRTALSRLVSRDVTRLDVDQIREAAIETLAENLNDSLVAPLFWFAIAGLPGAVVYRFANTADAMWGYRGRWEWAGKFAARADDVLSWPPARLTAALLWPRDGGALRREALRMPSPNGGWPMAAMALRLGVRLRKPGVYALNAEAPSPSAAALGQALRVAARAAWLAVGLVAIGLCLR